ERLIRVRAQVDDREPPMTEADATVTASPKAGGVRPAMHEPFAHPFDDDRIDRRARDGSDDPAHQLPSPLKAGTITDASGRSGEAAGRIAFSASIAVVGLMTAPPRSPPARVRAVEDRPPPCAGTTL